jgi:hypothetical protein
MNTILRRKRVARGIGPYRRHELLTGVCKYAVQGYDGYGDGTSTNVTDYISDEMKADWKTYRAKLMRFWASGEYTTADNFPDSLPWLFVRGREGRLPWAARNLG